MLAAGLSFERVQVSLQLPLQLRHVPDGRHVRKTAKIREEKQKGRMDEEARRGRLDSKFKIQQMASRTPFRERSAAANAAILSPSGAPRRKRTLASPGKNMFSNAKNPDLMLGASSEKNASAVLDEWSALSVEERMHESSDQTFLSPGPMTRNRRASKTPARKISPTQVAKPSSPLQPPSPGGISAPVFSPVR